MIKNNSVDTSLANRYFREIKREIDRALYVLAFSGDHNDGVKLIELIKNYVLACKTDNRETK